MIASGALVPESCTHRQGLHYRSAKSRGSNVIALGRGGYHTLVPARMRVEDAEAMGNGSGSILIRRTKKPFVDGAAQSTIAHLTGRRVVVGCNGRKQRQN